MFIRFFKSSFFAQYLTTGIIGLVLWVPAFLHPSSLPAPGPFAPLYEPLHDLLSGLPVVATAAGFLLALGSAFFFNVILNRNGLTAKNASLPALLYLVFLGFYPAYLSLHPLLIVQFFLLVILKTLFDAYNRPEPFDLYYSAGFFTALAALFYPPFSIALVYLWIAFVLFRSSAWREWAASFIGFATPFLFLAVWYFWSDQLEVRLHDWSGSFRVSPGLKVWTESRFLLPASLFLFMFLYSFALTTGKLTEKTIEIRRKSIVMNWSAFLALASFPFSGPLSALHLILLVPVTAFLCSLYLLSLRKSFWQEVFLLVFFLLVLANAVLSTLWPSV